MGKGGFASRKEKTYLILEKSTNPAAWMIRLSIQWFNVGSIVGPVQQFGRFKQFDFDSMFEMIQLFNQINIMQVGGLINWTSRYLTKSIPMV